MALHRRHPCRTPSDPVLVVHCEGWIDAGMAGATAVAALVEGGTEEVATFDGDALIDYRARRPVVRLSDGLVTAFTWRRPQLLLGRDRSGRDVLLLVGPEPDFRWEEFSADVVGLAGELGVRMVVGLGAFPAPVPHTRPVRVASTSPDPALVARVGFVPGTLEVPAGIEAALEMAFHDVGVPALGLWARVPHYIAGMPYPAAAAALVHGLGSVADLAMDTAELDASADVALRRVDELIAQSAEHQAMVRELEHHVDAAEGNPMHLGEVPSGDQIAAELERFLRGEAP